MTPPAASQGQVWTVPFYLAFKEIWRNRGRFFAVSAVTALITILVLFIAGLGEGLGNGNREYLSKLDADLIVYQARSDFLIAASRIPRARLNGVRRVSGVAAAGPFAVANATITNLPGGDERAALIGIEPGTPTEPPVVQGRQISTNLANEVILERSIALRTGLIAGDTITLRVTQGTRDQFYPLRVVGVSDGRQYGLQPAIFLPYFTWDKVRPKSEAEIGRADTVGNQLPVINVIAVKLADPAELAAVRARLEAQVDNVEVTTVQDAINNLPGYTAQQSTIQTQGVFTLLIGLLVIAGFFQIQILQKVAQIGVLKAIGTTNPLVGAAVVFQIVLITTFGVALGGLATFLFSLVFPPTVPIVFNGTTVIISVVSLLLIGPVGGLVSVRYAVRIEPLRALGLGG